MDNTLKKADGTEIDVRGLRARVAGEVVLPGDESWETARLAWNLAVDQRPAAVVLAESADDVVAVVRFAREHGLQVAPQGTGHNAGPLGPLQDTVLLKTERMRGVSVDPAERRARVEAGVLWMEVTAAASEHGLVGLAGSAPDVGVVGYSLGGGVSWLARKHGLSANSILAVEIVTADGRLVRADAEHETDLFWALRGGGGSFGVVTALEIRLYPISEVYAGWLIWPQEQAAEVLHAWREWVEDVPDEITSVARLLNLPPVPDIPEPFRGRSFVAVEATFIGTEAEAAGLLAPLRALAPEMDTFATMPASQLHHLHMDPEQPVAGRGDGMLLRELSAGTVEAVLAAAGPESGSQLLSVELRHLGGALADAKPENGALAAFDAAFLMFAVSLTMGPESEAGVRAQVHAVQRALAPWNAGQMYLNFREEPGDASEFYAASAYRRLREIKADVDPGELFRSNHPIQPAYRTELRAA